MLSPASQKPLLSRSTSSKTLIHIQFPHRLTHRDLEQSKLNCTIIAKKHNSAKSGIKTKINVSCVNCDFEEKREWQGWVIGKGVIGSLNAFIKRIKHNDKLLKRKTSLMKLLTVCDDCCVELDWHGKPDQDHILSVGKLHKMPASLVLSLSYKEIEKVISSKAIIVGGLLTNTIKTVSIDGREKEWDLLFENI